LSRKPGIVLLAVTALTLLAVACAINTDANFRFGWTYETDRVVNVSGAANKHVGGEQSTFTIELNNQDSVVWQARYCIVIVDEERLISVFSNGEIDLQPGEQSTVTSTGVFPEGELGKRYGIRFVLPGEPVGVASSVWSGHNDQQRKTEWFVVSDCSTPA
jgi:hypothetical protein